MNFNNFNNKLEKRNLNENIQIFEFFYCYIFRLYFFFFQENCFDFDILNSVFGKFVLKKEICKEG